MNFGWIALIALAISSVWGLAMVDLLHREDLTQQENTRWFVALWVGNLIAAVIYWVWRAYSLAKRARR